MNNIFQTGRFILSSGNKSDFKIECDNLDSNDLEFFKSVILKKYNFKRVVSVPRGGDKLTKLLKYYEGKENNSSRFFEYLIIDDVYTTGKSMRKIAAEIGINIYYIQGIVMFARGRIKENWIDYIFQLNDSFI